jgi:hypothetical protein
MHKFFELIDRCTAFTLAGLDEVNTRTTDLLQQSGSASLVKTLQMIELQKAILVVGMFSLFEAILQDELACKNGFKEIERILECENEDALKDSFKNVYLAVNVLKHGRGHSYNALVDRATEGLPFQIKMPSQSFFDEGNVSEISTLIQVDSAFVMYCADLIRQVSEVAQRKSSAQATEPSRLSTSVKKENAEY